MISIGELDRQRLISEYTALRADLARVTAERDEALGHLGIMLDRVDALRYGQMPERPGHACTPGITDCDGDCAAWGWLRIDVEAARAALAKHTEPSR